MLTQRKWEPLVSDPVIRAGSRAADVEPAETTWLRFLCVDDEPRNRDWVRRAFESFDDQGQEIVFAYSVDQAILSLRTSGFDAVLLSTDMKSVRDISRVIRVLSGANALPVIAYSKSMADDLCSLCISAGAEDCIPTSALSGVSFARAVHRNIERACRREQLRLASDSSRLPKSSDLAAMMSGFEDPIFIVNQQGAILSMTSAAASLLVDTEMQKINVTGIRDGVRVSADAFGLVATSSRLMFTAWSVHWHGESAFLILPVPQTDAG